MHRYQDKPQFPYQDSAVLQPYNVVPSDAVRCMNCGRMVSSQGMPAHIQVSHPFIPLINNQQTCLDLACCYGDESQQGQPPQVDELPTVPVAKVYILSSNDCISNDLLPSGTIQCQAELPTLHYPMYQETTLHPARYTRSSAPLKYEKRSDFDWDEKVTHTQSDSYKLAAKTTRQQSSPGMLLIDQVPQKPEKIALQNMTFSKKKIESENMRTGKIKGLAFAGYGAHDFGSQQQVMYVPASDEGCFGCSVHVQVCGKDAGFACLDDTQIQPDMSTYRNAAGQSSDRVLQLPDRETGCCSWGSTCCQSEKRFVPKITLKPMITYQEVMQGGPLLTTYNPLLKYRAIPKAQYYMSPESHPGAVTSQEYHQKGPQPPSPLVYVPIKQAALSMPFPASQMNQWKKLYVKRRGQEGFDQAVTGAIWAGVRDEEGFGLYLDKW